MASWSYHAVYIPRSRNVYVCRFTNIYLNMQSVYQFHKSFNLFLKWCFDYYETIAYTLLVQHSVGSSGVDYYETIAYTLLVQHSVGSSGVQSL